MRFLRATMKQALINGAMIWGKLLGISPLRELIHHPARGLAVTRRKRRYGLRIFKPASKEMFAT